MKRKTIIYIAILFTVFFIVSLFLPVVQFLFENQLNGIEAFALNFGRLFLVQSYWEYLEVMSTVLTNFFVLTLVIWSYRERVKLAPVILVSTLSIVSALFWISKYFSKGILLYGYWFWLILIIALIVFNLYKYQKQKGGVL